MELAEAVGERLGVKIFTENSCGSLKSCIFAAAKGYLARVVRDRSAKPGTAVRVRQVPQKPAQQQAFFVFYVLNHLESVFLQPKYKTRDFVTSRRETNRSHSPVSRSLAVEI